MRTDRRLVGFSHGAGCGCKLGPAELERVMGSLAGHLGTDPDLLVGTETGDDAAVYRLDDQTALIVTTDFFTPIVDDPYEWGRIAAANAMSDVYAMGGRPLLCLNIAAWPREALPLEMLGRVLEGGAERARAAGALVAGGHTIDDPEPKYGMAVVGLVAPDRIVTNARARAGDILVLTKPLGVGVVATAVKAGAAGERVVAEAITQMTTLNAAAADAMTEAGVEAATDVTGFGVLGHLHRMLLASGVAADLRAASIPVLEGARALVEAGHIAGGSRRNREYVAPHVRAEGIDEQTWWLLADAQTSGGLLMACPPGRIEGLMAAMETRAVPAAAVGVVREGSAGAIRILPD